MRLSAVRWSLLWRWRRRSSRRSGGARSHPAATASTTAAPQPRQPPPTRRPSMSRIDESPRRERVAPPPKEPSAAQAGATEATGCLDEIGEIAHRGEDGGVAHHAHQLSSAALRRLAQEIAASEGASEGGSHTPSLGPLRLSAPPRRKVREPRWRRRWSSFERCTRSFGFAALVEDGRGGQNRVRVTTIEVQAPACSPRPGCCDRLLRPGVLPAGRSRSLGGASSRVAWRYVLLAI